jgi:hypothetical protein
MQTIVEDIAKRAFMIYANFISDFKHTQRDRWLVIVAGDRLQQGFLLPKPELFTAISYKQGTVDNERVADKIGSGLHPKRLAAYQHLTHGPLVRNRPRITAGNQFPSAYTQVVCGTPRRESGCTHWGERCIRWRRAPCRAFDHGPLFVADCTMMPAVQDSSTCHFGDELALAWT